MIQGRRKDWDLL